MSLSSLSVRRGVAATMVFIAVLGFGLFSLSRLRLDLYPDISFPLVVAVTQYDGAGPREIEDLISRPIEGALSSVEGAKKVTSTSKQGVSLVMVEFDWGADLQQAEIDVRKNIDLTAALLPEDARDPIIFALDPSMQPIVFMGVAGPYPETKLREITEERIEPMIERIEGVAIADTVGGGKREIQVQLDPRRLAAAGISPTQVVSALRADNVQLPSGSFDQGGWEFTIQTRGKFTSMRDIESVVVGQRQGVPLRVRDVATVKDGLQEQTRIVRTNGRPGLMLMVRKQSDANTVQVVRAVKAALPGIAAKAARGMQLSVLFDQGEIVEKSIGNLSTTGLQAAVLAFFVLLFFLRSTRPSLIVAVSIPLSVIATFSIMDALGLTLNIISMSGLALAIGMLVDNAIVVQESVFLHAEAGTAPRDAAVVGTHEVSTAITAATLTTVVVFLPVLFVPGIAGRMFRDMSLTVCVSLIVSLLVALSAVPLAASRLLARQLRAPGRVSRSVGGLHAWIDRSYARSLGWALRNRKKTYGLVTLAVVLSIVSAGALPQQFFPRHDTALTVLQVKGPVGSSLEVTDAAFRRIERIVAEQVPERKALNTDFGAGEGFIALFAEGAHSGIMRLKLVDKRERKRGQLEIEDELRRRINRIPGISAQVMQPNLFGSEGDLVVEIYCHDLVEARRVGLELKELVASVKGTADVTFSLEAGRPEYEVLLDRPRLAALGLNTTAVSMAISTFYAGKLASTYLDGGNEYDIRVRGPKEARRDARQLASLPLATPTGAAVPLSAIAKIAPAVGPAVITRKDQQRMVTVNAAVPGKNLGAVIAGVEQKLSSYAWPEGTTYRIGGSAEDLKKSFKWLGVALMASILLVYMVMASQFESLLHPFLILFTLPLAGVGVVITLVATRTSVSVTALIGALILVGIVVNNAIVLIDYMNQLRAGGMELLPAVLEAGKRRLRPVLMTAGTTVLGMLPLALEIGEGSEGWSPMARVISGGLTFATALTLLVIPSVYLSVESFREKRRARRAARKARRTGEQPAAAE